MAEDNHDFPSARNKNVYMCLSILHICLHFGLTDRKDQIFKGSRHTAEYFEVSYENPPHFPSLSLSICAHLGVFKSKF